GTLRVRAYGFIRHHLQDHVQAAFEVEAEVNVLADAGYDAPTHAAFGSRLAHSVNAGFGICTQEDAPQEDQEDSNDCECLYFEILIHSGFNIPSASEGPL